MLTGRKGANAVKGTGLPGRFGTDYAFIDKKGIDVYVDQHKVSYIFMGLDRVINENY